MAYLLVHCAALFSEECSGSCYNNNGCAPIILGPVWSHHLYILRAAPGTNLAYIHDYMHFGSNTFGMYSWIFLI